MWEITWRALKLMVSAFKFFFGWEPGSGGKAVMQTLVAIYGIRAFL